ncbi:GtrA family protein [Bombilactobacillus thymidiniphilus]|uniref:GtrA family protein n=1 Tax=Bombilactobacillus thymidiniphilus TaxID=2923363 RepID=A0ABY4PFS1_9LACO|nr:GtrA family protein [Bombilactobacillus thymidiniphilus]UQS84354.1 GtrA family protein [Bombilactobacillus thymidiniphilus]
MIAIIKQYWEVISYLIFGGLTTVINLGVFTFLYTWGHYCGVQVANLIAWVLSVLFAYITNKLYVFDSRQSSKQDALRELGSFFFFRVASYLLDVAILAIGISWLHMNSFLVKVLDNVLVVVVNYIFSKLIIFRQRD